MNRLPGTFRASGCGLVVLVLVAAFAFLAFFLSGGLALFSAIPGLGGNNPPAGGNPPAGALTYRGSDTSGDLPLISARDFISGDAQVSTSGAFTLGSTIGPVGGQSDGVDAGWFYGTYPAGDSIYMGFSRLEGSDGLGLNVTSGDWIATYLGEGCSWEVEVAPSSVSGHISCTDILAVNEATGATGTIDIELDFSAETVPVDVDAPPSTPQNY